MCVRACVRACVRVCVCAKSLYGQDFAFYKYGVIIIIKRCSQCAYHRTVVSRRRSNAGAGCRINKQGS